MRCKMVSLMDDRNVFSASTAEDHMNEALAAIESDGSIVVMTRLIGDDLDDYVLMVLYETAPPAVNRAVSVPSGGERVRGIGRSGGAGIADMP